MKMWTTTDEANLVAMLERKKRFEMDTMGNLTALCDQWGRGPAEGESMAKFLRQNAENFRDALAPFDSGDRCIDTVEGC